MGSIAWPLGRMPANPALARVAAALGWMFILGLVGIALWGGSAAIGRGAFQEGIDEAAAEEHDPGFDPQTVGTVAFVIIIAIVLAIRVGGLVWLAYGHTRVCDRPMGARGVVKAIAIVAIVLGSIFLLFALFSVGMGLSALGSASGMQLASYVFDLAGLVEVALWLTFGIMTLARVGEPPAAAAMAEMLPQQYGWGQPPQSM